MNLACSTLHYEAAGWSLEDALADIADAGYRGVEITVGGRFAPAQLGSGGPVRTALTELGLEPVATSTSLAWAGAEDELEANRQTMREIIESSIGLGVPHVVVVTGPWPEGCDRGESRAQILANLRWILDQAAGLNVALEVVGVKWPDSHWLAHDVATFEATRAEVGGDLRANFDPSNYLSGGDDPVTAIEALGPSIAGVHLKDAARRGGRWECVPPGEGEVDFAGVLAALVRVGFTGWYVVEDESWTGGRPHHPAERSRAAREYHESLEGMAALH